MIKSQEVTPDFPHQVEGLYSPFLNLSPTEYYGLVTDGVNFNNLQSITRKLESLELPKGVLVAVAGSDGKLERHAQSKTELIIIEESAALEGDILLRDFFGNEPYSELFDTSLDGVIDVKALDSRIPLSYAYGDSDAMYPDRILNTFPVFPITPESLDLYFRAREQTLNEISKDKRIKEGLRSQLRSYKKAMQTEEYRHIPTFDTDRHIQFYSEQWPAYTTGFKIPFLRTVQRKLDLLTLKLEGVTTWRDVAMNMPTTTIGRLEYLRDQKIISQEECSTTGDAYAWFLQQYHNIQENYKDCCTPVELPYDAGTFDEHRKSVEHFASL